MSRPHPSSPGCTLSPRSAHALPLESTAPHGAGRRATRLSPGSAAPPEASARTPYTTQEPMSPPCLCTHTHTYVLDVCTHTLTNVRVHVDTHGCIYTHVNTLHCVYIYVCVCVHMGVCVHLHTAHIHVRTHICTCVRTCTRVCTHTPVRMFTYAHSTALEPWRQDPSPRELLPAHSRASAGVSARLLPVRSSEPAPRVS